jgi:formate-dependent nitrite reductase membrane component NrfD
MTPFLVTTLPPHWEWLIILYFFFGGIAGGAYFMATLMRLVGGPQDRPVVRLGYYVAFPLTLLCGLLLVLDLRQPLRFLNMLFDFKQFGFAFKYWSPISFGAWVLFLFGVFSFLSFVGVVGHDRRVRYPLVDRYGDWMDANPVGLALSLVGALFAIIFTGYTGLLLATTSQPVWSDTPMLGALFLVSGVSTALAAMVVLIRWRRLEAHDAERRLETADNFMMTGELLLLLILLATLGSLAGPLLHLGYAVLLVVGVMIAGLLIPLALHLRPTLLGARAGQSSIIAAILVLLGGLLLRYVIIMAPQGP